MMSLIKKQSKKSNDDKIYIKSQMKRIAIIEDDEEEIVEKVEEVNVKKLSVIGRLMCPILRQERIEKEQEEMAQFESVNQYVAWKDCCKDYDEQMEAKIKKDDEEENEDENEDDESDDEEEEIEEEIVEKVEEIKTIKKKSEQILSNPKMFLNDLFMPEHNNDKFYEVDHHKTDDDRGKTYTTPEKIVEEMMKPNQTITSDLCLVQTRSDYSIFYLDFDYKDIKTTDKQSQIKIDAYNCYHNNEEAITKFLIATVDKVLDDVFDNIDKSYIYCDKSSSKGIHLYYPRILVNKALHKKIMNLIYDELDKDKTFDFIESVTWRIIVDYSVWYVSLRIPYFEKKGDAYKINKSLSTFPLQNYNRRDQLLLCFPNQKPVKVIPKLNKNIDMDVVNDLKLTHKTEGYSGKKDTNGFKLGETEEEIKKETDKLHDHLYNLNKERYGDSKEWYMIVQTLVNYKLGDLAKKWSEWVKVGYKGQITINEIDYMVKKMAVNHKSLTKSYIYQQSRKDNQKHYYILVKKHDKLEIKNTDEFLQINVKYDSTCKEYKITNTTIEEIVDTLLNKGYKTIMINAPPSAGKTTAFRRIVQKIGKRINILVTTSRQSMAPTVKRAMNSKDKNFPELKSLDMVSYLPDSRKRKGKKPVVNNSTFRTRYICSYEKLAQYKDPANQQFGDVHQCHPSYDLIIIDECNSALRHFYCKTMDKNRKKSMNNLMSIIKKASYVILADANITNLVHSFVDDNSGAFGKVYKYRNTSKPKENVKFTMYNKKDNSKSDWQYVAKFCLKIREAIEKGESVFIGSDSLTYVQLIRSLLAQFYTGSDKQYFKMFTREDGNPADLLDINKLALNHCLIVSPKVIYGVSIDEVEYDNIYSIYSHMDSNNFMSPLEYHQQLSRCRKVRVSGGGVHVLNLDTFHKDRMNLRIDFEEHTRLVGNDMKKYVSLQNDLMNTCIDSFDELDDNSLFKMKTTHLYYTYQNRLFADKAAWLLKFAEEDGYIVKSEDIEVSEKEVEEINKIVKTAKINLKAFKNNKKDIQKEYIKTKVINGDLLNDDWESCDFVGFDNIGEVGYEIERDIDEEDEDTLSNAEQDLKKKAEILGSWSLKVLDDGLCQGMEMRQRYLDRSYEEFRLSIGADNKKDSAYAAMNNTLVKRVTGLKKVEDALHMKRYRLEDIDKIKNVNIAKKNLKAIMSDIVNIKENNSNLPKHKKMLESLIDAIETTDDIKLIVAEYCYNMFGKIFDKTGKRETTGERKMKYSFKLL